MGIEWYSQCVLNQLNIVHWKILLLIILYLKLNEMKNLLNLDLVL